MNRWQFKCSDCDTRCDGQSLGKYIFENDVAYSERKENALIRQICSVDGFFAQKCEQDGYPDIEVFHQETGSHFFIEVKAQRRTFMAIERILPQSNLVPSETLCCNLSDLIRYFQIQKSEGCKVFIVWCLENRPCIVPSGETKYYYIRRQLLLTVMFEFLWILVWINWGTNYEKEHYTQSVK